MALQRHVKWLFAILVFANIVIMAIAFSGGFSSDTKKPAKANPVNPQGTNTNNPAR